MVSSREKMEKAKAVLTKMAKGVDPLTGELLKEESFINDPQIIRCFYFISEVLDNVINGVYSKNNKLTHFIISAEQKSVVNFPVGKIGINEFARQINLCTDTEKCKKLTGVELNKRLKKMGVLSEEKYPATGKMRTVTNGNSGNYGFETEKRSFNGNEYDMVVMNDKGKRYMLDNIEQIMNMDI